MGQSNSRNDALHKQHRRMKKEGRDSPVTKEAWDQIVKNRFSKIDRDDFTDLLEYIHGITTALNLISF